MCESITVQQLFFLPSSIVMKVILLLCVPRMSPTAGWLDTALTLTV